LNWVRRTLLSNWLVRAISTTIGQKLVMGATGLLLCGFLVAHLAGNMLIFQGAEHYNNYAKRLHENELLPVAEAGLLVLFVLHILLSFTTARVNTSARPIGYADKRSKLKGETMVHAHNFMFVTGVIVLGFTLLHLSDMRFAHLNLRLKYDSSMLPAEHAMHVLRDPISATVYLLGSLVLGVHLSHGFQSAFKSLGLNHPKYTPILGKLSVLFAIVIGLGFAWMPWYFYFMGH
jgi:succinate dehydrogenase / fumarate reductase cytochrome b subunit